MSVRAKTATTDDPYCQLCSSVSGNKRLSSFSCDHCRLLLCYDCFEKHTRNLPDEHSQLQKRFFHLTDLFHNKKQLFATFEEHCLRNVNSTFDEIINDLQKLRKESIDYVKRQFNDADIVLSDMITHLKPSLSKSQQPWSGENITKNVTHELEVQQKIHEIENCLEVFSSPTMQLNMSTFPRNKFHLHCQLLLNSYQSSKKFSPSYPGKIITTKCTCHPQTENESEKIDVDTEVEELNPMNSITKQIQTDSKIESILNTDEDEDEYYSVRDEINELNHQTNTDYCLSTRYRSQGTIVTQNEVDRIASDGEHLLYFSETSKSLCYITNISSDRQTNGISMTKEITCRWPHHTILDLIYSPISSQFICATKTGVYTCSIDDNSTIDIQMQLTQHWSYVRLSADKNVLWLWTDTPRLSQLHIYSPKTFDCLKSFNLNDYPRFVDNSTSFCIQSNLLATVFQYKQTTKSITSRKYFHVTLCDSTDLHELCTIHLGECDIDHEIRANNDGKFFITNGKKKLWIVDQNGKREFVKLDHTGRALTIHQKNQILIANGTQQLQRIEQL